MDKPGLRWVDITTTRPIIEYAVNHLLVFNNLCPKTSNRVNLALAKPMGPDWTWLDFIFES